MLKQDSFALASNQGVSVVNSFGLSGNAKRKIVQSFAVIGLFVASVMVPLATYTLSLAFFGLAHVLWEMRYVQVRFQKCLPNSALLSFFLLLMGVVSLRFLMLHGFISGFLGCQVELLLVAGLSLTANFIIWRYFSLNGKDLIRKKWVICLSSVFCLGLGFGSVYAPITVLLLFSVAHNLTPIAFIWEATEKSKRVHYLFISIFLFIVLPLAIASGFLQERLGDFINFGSIFRTGSLSQNLGAYLPSSLREAHWATYAFSGCVFAQCMHYAATIYLYPRLQKESAPNNQLWKNRYTWVFFIIICLFATIPFFYDFRYARSYYGIISALHAWIEIPLLLLMLAGLKSVNDQSQPERKYIGDNG